MFILRRGGKVKHGGLFERLVVCGNRHSIARDCHHGSLHPAGVAISCTRSLTGI